jgi:HPt (histidine-containing phosphotransfer) domain-containing protein
MSIPGSSEVNDSLDQGASPMTTDSAVLPVSRSFGHVDELPLLDLAAFQLLEDQLDNPLIARSFARDFTKLWEKRYRALATAIELEDVPAALDAVLSLKTSSTMVGGIRLAALAASMEQLIRTRELHEGTPLLAAISFCGNATVKELQVSYVLRND